MSRFKVVRIVDFLFKMFVIFLVSFAWIRFYVYDLTMTLLVSIPVTLALSYIMFVILNMRKNKKQISAKQLQQCEECFISFQLMTKSDQLNFLYELIPNEFEKKKEKQHIKYNSNDAKCALVPLTEFDIINDTQLLNCVKSFLSGYKKVIIICGNYTDSAKKMSKAFKNIQVILLNKQETYANLFLEYNKFPANDCITKNATKLTFKDILKLSISKEKTKGYFISGIFLIFASIIIPYSLYYIIFGSCLLVLSLVCFLNKDKSASKKFTL